MLGNYGVPASRLDEHGLEKDFESKEVHVSGVICQDYSYRYSHWNATRSLGDWLKAFNVPGIHGIDTRLLTKKIR
jgi:carbamoyl-phosphate synthase small subunit